MLASTNRLVDLMCVVPKVPDHTHDRHRERLYRRAQAVVDKTKTLFTEEGISASPVLRTGSPARVLIGASYNYDVTIVAAASRRSASQVGLGPVARSVAEHAYGAVLLARESQSQSGLRVLMLLDGSESSLTAMRTAAQVIDVREAEITLLHVVETPWLHPGPDQEWLGYEEENEERIDPEAQIQQAFAQDGEGLLQAAWEQLPQGAAVSTRVREGIPGDEILSEVESGAYDLVVAGASGSHDLKHKILGSVSGKVAWNAPCSVLLIGPSGERPV
jgi:nucleotide-binding universal stress UspA family protein